MSDESFAQGELVAELAARIDASKHRFLSELRVLDVSGEWNRQGFRSCAQWMSWRLGWETHTSREYVRTAHALEKLPAIDDALRRGKVSYAKVRAMTRVATPENEATLLEQAELTTASQLAMICRKYATILRDGQYGPTAEDDSVRRTVSRRERADGMVVITAVLHADEAERVWTALDRVGAELCRKAKVGHNEAASDDEVASVTETRAVTSKSLMHDHSVAIDDVAAVLHAAVRSSSDVDVGAGDAVAGDAVAGDAFAGDAVAGDAFAGDAFAGDAVAGDAVAGEVVAGTAVAGGVVADDAVAGGVVVGDASSRDVVEVAAVEASAVEASAVGVSAVGAPAVEASAVGAPAVGVSAVEVSDVKVSDVKVSDVKVSDVEVDAFEVDAFEVDAFEVDAFEVDAGVGESQVTCSVPASIAAIDAVSDAVANNAAVLDASLAQATADRASSSELDLEAANRAYAEALAWSPRTDSSYWTPPASWYEEEERDEPNYASIPISKLKIVPSAESRERQRQERRTRFDRANALVAMAEQVLRGSSERRSPTEVVVTISAEALAGSGPERVGVLGSGTCVPAETVRRLCCDAGIVAVLERREVCEGGERSVGDGGAGHALQVGRKSRSISAALMRVLAKRDRTCTFPGCTTRVFLEGHHMKHWADGGATAIDNLCRMCSHHHRFVHEYGYSVSMIDGRPQFRDARGRDVPAVPSPPPPSVGVMTDAMISEPDESSPGEPWSGYDGTPVSYPDLIEMLIRADRL